MRRDGNVCSYLPFTRGKSVRALALSDFEISS